MKKLFYVILPIVVLMVSSCGQKKKRRSLPKFSMTLYLLLR